MDSACGRHGRGENYVDYLVRKIEGNNHSTCEDNIKNDLTEIECNGVGRIHLVYVRDEWWALMNKLMKFKFSNMRGIF